MTNFYHYCSCNFTHVYFLEADCGLYKNNNHPENSASCHTWFLLFVFFFNYVIEISVMFSVTVSFCFNKQ